MRTGLTKQEKTTDIWFDEKAPLIHIRTHNTDLKKRLAEMCIRDSDYTVMSNHHLRNANLSLKAKGLLSMMLFLPEDWNYTTRGLAKICKEGVDAIGAALRELEAAGYIVRHKLRDRQGRISDTESVSYTHLDVYKRQGPDLRRGKRSGRRHPPAEG